MSASARCCWYPRRHEREEAMRKHAPCGRLLLAGWLALAPLAGVMAQEAWQPDEIWGETMRAGRWRVSIAPYTWATSVNGTVEARGLEGDIELGFDDILEDL